MQYNVNVNTRIILLHFIYIFFFNFHKLVFNEVLYLQKHPLVGTLQKWLLSRALFFIKAAAQHLN